jgi:hypothetical protein
MSDELVGRMRERARQLLKQAKELLRRTQQDNEPPE